MKNSILFIDQNVADYQVFLANLGSEVEVHVLNGNEDGVLQMADVLRGRSSVDNIQIISHGSSGALSLGSAVLSNDNLSLYQDALAQIGSSLTATGDILLYGCNVGQSFEGVQFIENLAQYTGADVAASDDLTGNTFASADWNLEKTTGYIEATALIQNDIAAFGNNTLATAGIITTDLGSTNDYAKDVIQQSDGKLVVSGHTTGTYSNIDFALVRYNNNGSLDPNFDSDGIVVTPITLNNDSGQSVIQQTDGKLVLAGTGNSSISLNSDIAVVRYNSDGSLDTSFDGDGQVVTNIGYNDHIGNMIQQSDGKLVAAGYSGSYPNYDFVLIRYNNDGSLDTSFDGDGIVTTAIGSSADYGSSIIQQSDGKLVVAGMIDKGEANYDFALIRYNSDGSLDTSFDGDGKLTTDMGSTGDWAYSVIQQTDGKLVVAGRAGTYPAYDFALARYNSNGSLDTSFDGDGRVITNMGSDYDSASSVIQQSDGKLVVVGLTGSYSSYDFALVRYNNDGSLDSSFDADGKLIMSVSSGNDSISSVIQQSDGKLVVAGYSGTDFALVRYNTDGSLDSTFNGINPNNNIGQINITGTITQNQILTANIVDIDGIAKSLISYQWLANGVAINAATASSYTLTQAEVGKAITVSATYTDALGTKESVTSSATNAVANVNDVGQVSISGTASQNQTLTASVADVDGVGTSTIAYQWLANGVAINGTTANNYTLTQAEVGKAITVNAVYTDALGTQESVSSSATNAVANVNDTGQVTISGTATQNQSLTANVADVDGVDSGAIAYQWLASGVAINGATASSYTLTQAEIGKAITVSAVYTDALGTQESVTSSATSTVANVNDTLAGTVTVTGIAKQGQVLTASNTFTDADGVGAVAYQWLADGVAIGTGETYTLTANEAGKTISVIASYTDLQGTLESAASNSTAVVGGLFSGSGANNSLIGGSGDDTLQGAVGNDVLQGGLGADSMSGGADNDTYYVDNPGDVVTEASATGGVDTVRSSISYTLPKNLEKLILEGALPINGQGNVLDNLIKGNSGVNILSGLNGADTLKGGGGNDNLKGGDGLDLLNGGGGADNMSGGAGDDIYVIGVKGDKVSENSRQGIDLIESSISYVLGNNVENLSLTGNKAIHGSGNGLDNILIGNKAANVLTGNAGSDTIKGMGGNDKLIGNAGDDNLLGGNGKDIFKLSDFSTDTLKDFNPADDSIQLENSAFKKLTSNGQLKADNFALAEADDANDFVVYDDNTGGLYYDADGSGNDEAVQIAIIGTSSHPTLSAADFVVV